jgi:hypothetical protein
MLMINKSAMYRRRLREFYDSLQRNRPESAPDPASPRTPQEEEFLKLINNRSAGREARFVELVARRARENH